MSDKPSLPPFPDNMPELGVYKHIKTGNQYRIVGFCRIELTCEPAVAYQTKTGALEIFVRPISEFVDGRFVMISKDDPEDMMYWVSDRDFDGIADRMLKRFMNTPVLKEESFDPIFPVRFFDKKVKPNPAHEGDWVPLHNEPCRFCRRSGKVFYLNDSVSTMNSETVRRDNCGRSWEADSSSA